MSYAPQSLLDARSYLHRQTGLSLAALGIVGDSAHRYGYHLGRDRLPSSDYSRQTARDRAGLSNAASALDIGSFRQLWELTAFMVRQARAGQLRDVRELIGPGSDGRAYRWDDLNGWSAVRRASGDSHEWHLHISYYRDSEGRSKLGPFRSFFEGEDDMPTADEVADAIYKRLTHVVGPDEAAVRTGLFEPGRTTRPEKALEYSWGYSKGAWRQGRDLLAGQSAILAAVTGQDPIAAFRAELDRHRAALVAELGDDLAAAVAAELQELPADQVEAAVGRALARTRLAVEQDDA